MHCRDTKPLETCALLGCYSAHSANSVPTFRDNLSVRLCCMCSIICRLYKLPGPTVLHVFHYLSVVQITRSDCVACVPLSVGCTNYPVRLCCMCSIICRLYKLPGPTVLHVYHYLSDVQITRSDCVACVPLSVGCTNYPVRLCCMCSIICRMYKLRGPTVLHVFHYLSVVQITRPDCAACVPLSVGCTNYPVRLCCMCSIICRMYKLTLPSPSPSHSATESFRFNVKICSRSALLRRWAKNILLGPEPAFDGPRKTRKKRSTNGRNRRGRQM
jgi:hypothetical protein